VNCLDCAPNNAARFPGNTEICDGVDNDCDTALPADEADADADTVMECSGDCDDSDASVSPLATEICDGLDTDCDGFLSRTTTLPFAANTSLQPLGTWRGSLFEATRDTTLQQYQQRVVVDAGETVVLALYRQDALGYAYRLMASSEFTAASSGSAWFASDPWNIPLETGVRYATVAWSPDQVRMRESTAAASTTLPFATVIDGIEGQADGLADFFESPTTATALVQSKFTWGGEDDADADGVSVCAGDCQDGDASFQPGPEVCDGVDNDCRRGDDDPFLQVSREDDEVLSGSGTVQLPVYVVDDGVVADVNVWVSSSPGLKNMDLNLISPAGTAVQLYSWGGTRPTIDARFDDESPITAPVGGNPLLVEEYAPTGSLSAFDGESTRGTWLLEWEDTGSQGATSTTVYDYTVELTLAGGSVGQSAACAVKTCDDLQDADPTAISGIYWLERYWDTEDYQTLCDMTNDGGGWTLVANIDDDRDPYFGGHAPGNSFSAEWIEAWEDDNVRNETIIPTMNGGVSFSTKYASYSEVWPQDLRIQYQVNNKHFLCEGLTPIAANGGVPGTLDVQFTTTPVQDTCASVCTTWSENRFTQQIPNEFAGLNCSDGNEPWYPDPYAENARIGARWSVNQMEGFLGTMGPRLGNGYLEHTWANDLEGETQESDVLLFVR